MSDLVPYGIEASMTANSTVLNRLIGACRDDIHAQIAAAKVVSGWSTTWSFAAGAPAADVIE